MFFGRANLGAQKIMNSLAETSPSFPADSIFPDTVMYVVMVRDQYIYNKNLAKLKHSDSKLT